MDFEVNQTSLRIISNNESEYDLPHLWMRDNCPCNDCRVQETQEKRFMLHSVPSDLKPKSVDVDEKHIHLIWPDGHETSISFDDIKSLEKPRKPEKVLWTNDFIPSYFDWNDFLQKNEIAIDAISDFITRGVIVINGAPSVSNSLEELAPRLGPIREVLFERIHNVSVDGHVYNIAHTSLELPPHNDFASYTWPPSVQALHMLVNECEGGRSTIVDGFVKSNFIFASGPIFLSTLECEMSLSCHKAIFSRAGVTALLTILARPVRFSLKIGFFL